APAHAGVARTTSAASRPRPAPASTTTNGSGSRRRSHASSRARATTIPNSEPTSGLVTKSRPARPAPPPRVKKPSAGSYSASSMYSANETAPSRWMRSRMRASMPMASTGPEGEVSDSREELRVHADDHHDHRRERERDVECQGRGGGRPHFAEIGRLAE